MPAPIRSQRGSSIGGGTGGERNRGAVAQEDRATIDARTSKACARTSLSCDKSEDDARRRSPRAIAVLAAALSFALAGASAPAQQSVDDLAAERSEILNSPDLAVSYGQDIAAEPRVLNGLAKDPMLIMGLWKAYRFSPRYTARPAANPEGIHVDDPTGIEGNLYQISVEEGRRSYVAYGRVAHSLVPPFTGKALVFLDISPSADAKGSRLSLEIYMRMDNRFVGFMTRLFLPILKAGVLRRLGSNLTDFNSIAGELVADPERTAAKLETDDAARLRDLISLSYF